MPKRIIMLGDDIKISSPILNYLLLDNGRFVAPSEFDKKRMKAVGYCIDIRDGIGRICALNASADIRSDVNAMPVASTDKYSISVAGEVQTSDQSVAQADMTGFNATKLYSELADFNLENYPDYYYCKNYKDKVGIGEWYMPSLGELMLFINKYASIVSMLNNLGIDTSFTSNGQGQGQLSRYLYQIFSTTRRDVGNNWCYYFRGNKIAYGGRVGANVGSPYYNYCCTVPFLQVK